MVGVGPAPKAPDSCSTLAADEPLAGTAPFARAWIAIEQPGSWGRDALRSNALPVGIGPILADRAKAAEVGVLLIRHPKRPRHLSESDARSLWVAHIASNTLIRLESSNCRELLNWDLAAIAHGDLSSIGAPGAGSANDTSVEQPLALICCHAARDACCAIHGRALYDALLAQSSPEGAKNLWQCSHLGGHRFAPTMLLLPLGAVYGRVDLLEAQSAIQAASLDHLLPNNCRGQTRFTAPIQAADLYLRATLPILDRCALTYDLRPSAESLRGSEGGKPQNNLPETAQTVLARHLDGRAWALLVTQESLGLIAPQSCGDVHRPLTTWRVQQCQALTTHDGRA